MAKYAPFAVESVGETSVRFDCSLRDQTHRAWGVILIQESPSTTSQATPTHVHRAVYNNRTRNETYRVDDILYPWVRPLAVV